MEKKLKNLKFNKSDAITLGILVAIFGFFFVMVFTGAASNQMKSMIIPISYNIILAISLNLMVGFLGELSLGHAAFMSVGAYTGAFFSVKLVEAFPGLPIWVYFPLAMLVGGIAAAIAGIIIAIPALRLRGDYLAILTLAFGEIIRNIITNMPILGAAIGFDTGSITPKIAKAQTLLPFAAAAVLITTILILNFVRSKHGRAITAIRDNRIAAEASGINVKFYRMSVFAISAFFAGIAGVMYSHSQTLLKASTFDYNMSIEILVIVVLGGMGNMSGSVIASIIMYMLPEILRDFDSYRMLIYSVLLIGIMLFTSAPKLKNFREKFTFDNIKGIVIDRLKKSKKGGTKNE
ncbi:MAG: branched-chain amino acid ABC transporter permease [Ruminococcaceae bacterium]|nr:branched-chain amino acid ABC transporter permease [Oscillospiraceae bacterium]